MDYLEHPVINIRRPSTDHRPGRSCRCVLRPLGQKDERKCKHPGYPVLSMCQICHRHSCGNPDCDSSIGYVPGEHFGLRCGTCPFPKEHGPPSFSTRTPYGCQWFVIPTRKQCGPDYKDDDPEVIAGVYIAGEHRTRPSDTIDHFCLSAPEAVQLQGERVYGRTNHRRTHDPPEVEWESGHVYRTWDVCEDCQAPVYKSIRRYEDRLEKERCRREKEHYYQLDGLREGRKILADVKRLLKEKKKNVAMQSMQGYSR
jgi:hypothetical protein